MKQTRTLLVSPRSQDLEAVTALSCLQEFLRFSDRLLWLRRERAYALDVAKAGAWPAVVAWFKASALFNPVRDELREAEGGLEDLPCDGGSDAPALAVVEEEDPACAPLPDAVQGMRQGVVWQFGWCKPPSEEDLQGLSRFLANPHHQTIHFRWR